MAHQVRCEARDFGLVEAAEAWFASDLALPSHRHDHVQLVVVLEGALDLMLGGTRYTCTPGTVFTEPAGDRHSNAFGSAGGHVVIIKPHPDRADVFGDCWNVFEGLTHVQHAGIRSLAWRMAYEMRRPDAATPLAVQGLALEVLGTAARIQGPGRTRPPRWLRQAEEIIRARYLEGIDLDALAEIVDVHPVHLARAFRKYHRMSIGDFVRRLRLDWAMGRLAATEDPLAELALAAGFADQSHFTRAFKAHTGTTPGRYRRVMNK